MPNTRVRRNSVVDMLSKVHVNRGSLIKGIENLLKTIEISESAVMIPTLLRDKCEFDAWELLFVAKILKASILGHSDLVEFYMSHMGNSAAAAAATATVNGTSSSHLNGRAPSSTTTTTPTTATTPTTNGIMLNNLIDTGISPIASPNVVLSTQLPPSPSLSTTSSVSSVSTTTSGQQHSNGQQHSRSQQSSSSMSWMTANQQLSASVSSGSSFSNSLNGNTNESVSQSCSSASSNGSGTNNSQMDNTNQHDEPSSSVQQDQANLLTTRPLLRQAQPPSLLQLTTTNNHINSMVSGSTSNSIEQLTSQLTAMQTNGNGTAKGNSTNSTNGRLEGTLSISTSTANQVLSTSTNGTQTPTGTGNHGHHHELRTSRSAGCLFRINSGASSPRTPTQTTPYPQAETLANSVQSASCLLAADPGAPVKLLLQIEQLKTSINHITNLLESVVELYKKSIDEIAS